jgi:transposase
MGKSKEFTVAERKVIINQASRGHVPRKISEITGFKIPTIKTIIRKWKKTGSVVNQPRMGRPRKTTPRNDKRIINLALSNRRLVLPKLTEKVNEELCTVLPSATVKRRLHANIIKGRRATKKPWLSKVNQRKRLAWAKDHSTWTSDDWRKVLWSDESKFCIFCNPGVKYVWRRPGEKFRRECVTPTVNHGGGKKYQYSLLKILLIFFLLTSGSLMIWGSMAPNGPGNIVRISGIMNKEVYLQILEENLRQSVTKLRLGRRFIFQQDGDPKHTAKIVKGWLAKNKINVMDWPPQSPDLNPIEHLWFQLEDRLRRRRHQPKSVNELFEALSEEWQNIPAAITQNLVKSMPKRVAAVIAAKGGPTKY